MDVWNSVLSLFMEGYKESFSPLFAAFVKVGGYENLVSGYFEATASVQAFKVPGDNSSGLCGAVPQDAMHLFRSNVPGESDLPWTGVIFCLFFIIYTSGGPLDSLQRLERNGTLVVL